MKEVAYSKAALQALRRMPANTAVRLRSKIADYAADPSSQANNVKALQGTSAIRLRVGDWRIIMEDGAVLFIVQIASRGSIYS